MKSPGSGPHLNALQRAVGVLTVLSLLTLGAASTARAQTTTYTYTGATFTIYGMDPITGGNVYSCTNGSGECSISGSFTLSAPAGENYTGGVTPLSFDFTDGANVITQATIEANPNNFASFDIATNGSGQISGWDIGLQQWSSEGIVGMYTFDQLGSRDVSNLADDGQPPLTLGYAATQGGAAGQWSESSPDPISVTPEPNSLALVGTGLLLFACIGARRRKTLA